jgi:hypothetical protein
MKVIGLFAFIYLGAAWSQSAVPPAPPQAQAAPPDPAMPNLPDDAVVAVFDDGMKLTMAEFRRIYAILPPPNQQMALRDKQNFLHQWGLMRKLTQMGEKEKLDQEIPTKDALEYYRMMVLSQAKINSQVNSGSVEAGAVDTYYQGNKEKYKMVKVKAIYLAFSTTPATPVSSSKSGGKLPLTEEQAKAKADRLVKQIRTGADFVKLVKENSDDETSKNKDGDFATLRLADNVPDAIRAAVFALQQGETGDPVRQPNGFYILKAQEVTYRPLKEVEDEIFYQLRQEKFAKWMEQANRDVKVDFPNPAFLSGK